MNKGTEIIMKHEGCRLKAYKCPSGVWTIGYGHTQGVKEGDAITHIEAESMLIQDVIAYEAQVKRVVKSSLNANQIGALTSFNYNVGIGNLIKSTLLKKININPNDVTIASEFRRYVTGGGRVLGGLVKRREDEIALYFKKITIWEQE